MSSHGHQVRELPAGDFTEPGTFRLSWRVDRPMGRLRATAVQTRETDEAGAKRFAAKWGVAVQYLPKHS